MTQELLGAAVLALCAVPVVCDLRGYLASRRPHLDALQAPYRAALIAESDAAWHADVAALLREASVSGIRIAITTDTRDGQTMRGYAAAGTFGAMWRMPVSGFWRALLWRLCFRRDLSPPPAAATYAAWRREVAEIARRAMIADIDTLPPQPAIGVMCPLVLDRDMERAKRILTWAGLPSGEREARR